MGARIKQHDKTMDKDKWTHYFFFEVHDNISCEEILEIEDLLLRIFRHDPRVKLENVRLGSRVWRRSLSRTEAWSS